MFMGTGPEAFKQARAMMYSGFPDLRWTLEEIIAEGETVAERLTGRGTHQGEFMGGTPHRKSGRVSQYCHGANPRGQDRRAHRRAGHAGPDAADPRRPHAGTV